MASRPLKRAALEEGNFQLGADMLHEMAEKAGVETGASKVERPTNLDIPDFQVDSAGRMVFTWKLDQIRLIAENFERRRYELWALITVLWRDGNETKPRPLINKTRMNLRSASGKTDLVRYLKGQLDRDWSGRIEQVKEQIEFHQQSGEPLVWLSGQKAMPATYLMRPLIGLLQHTVLFADGESSKSTLALALALSVASGKQVVPGIAAPVQGKALFLDWEADKETFETRTARLSAGIGIAPPAERLAYKRLYSPLADAQDELNALIKEQRFDFCVCDSISGATLGQISDESAAMAYFMATRTFGVSVLSIAHVPKHGEHDRPIGTTFWFNQARALWELAYDQTEGDNEGRIDLICRKSNNDMRPRPFGLTLTFGDTAWNYKPALAGHANISRLPPDSRIERWLVDNGLKTVKEIAAALGMSQEYINNVLRHGEGKRFQNDGSKRDRLWWALEFE